MPGEAPPRTVGDWPETAASRDVRAAQTAAGNDEDAVVAVTPSFASACVFVVKEVCKSAVEELRERNRTMTMSDVIREVGCFGTELFLYVDKQLCELPVVQKFEEQPLMSLFPVVSVGLMMSCIGVCYSFMYLPAMHISVFSLNSTIFHGSFCLAFVAYHQGVITHPGGIPTSWKGQANGRPRFTLKPDCTMKFAPLERKKTTNGYRYCKNEGKFKPDRAHFCKLMGHNVLKMDHYCPWLANCVGLRNYKFFFLTLFYDAMAANIVNLSMIHALHVGGHSAIHVFMLSQGVVLGTVVSGVLTPFLVFHCWLVSKNLTTLEYCESKGRSTEMGAAESPYDVGVWKNISSVFGPEWYLWWLPTHPAIGDGLDFPVAPAHEYKKVIKPNIVMSTVAEIPPAEKADESDEDLDAAGVLTRRPTTNAADAGGGPRQNPLGRKCTAARQGVAGHLNDKSLRKGIESVGAGMSFCSAQLGCVACTGLTHMQCSALPAVSDVVCGGLSAYQECGEDLYAYASERARDAWSWWKADPPPPPPRISSTVSQQRAAEPSEEATVAV